MRILLMLLLACSSSLFAQQILRLTVVLKEKKDTFTIGEITFGQ